jgi:hypothetical protein
MTMVATDGTWLLHYDGTTWTNADPGCSIGWVDALWASGPSDLWAVIGPRQSNTSPPPVSSKVMHWDGKAWTVSLPADTDAFDTAANQAIWGRGPTDIWVAGNIKGVSSTGFWEEVGALYHYDGAAWSRATLPGGDQVGVLNGLWGSGPNDVWAVGQAPGAWPTTDLGGDGGTPLAVTVHWNGSVWSTVANPALGRLNAVWGSGSGDVWAVGDNGQLPPTASAIHWDGTAWSSVAGVEALQSATAVWGAGPGDAWAVGQNGAAHWDGTAWSLRMKGLVLNGVGGSSSSNVLAVGANGALLRWNGTDLVTQNGASDGYYEFLWGTGPTDVWAGGTSLAHWDGSAWTEVSRSDSYGGYTMWGLGGNEVWEASGLQFDFHHWDGTRWTSYPPPSGGHGGSPIVRGMWGSSPGDVWAVSDDDPVAHWDGKAWTFSESATDTSGWVVWGTSENDAWIVRGNAGGGTGAGIIHWNGTDWSATPVSGGAADLPTAIWGDAANDVWAAGVNAGHLYIDHGPAAVGHTRTRRSRFPTSAIYGPRVGMTFGLRRTNASITGTAANGRLRRRSWQAPCGGRAEACGG